MLNVDEIFPSSPGSALAFSFLRKLHLLGLGVTVLCRRSQVFSSTGLRLLPIWREPAVLQCSLCSVVAGGLGSQFASRIELSRTSANRVSPFGRIWFHLALEHVFWHKVRPILLPSSQPRHRLSLLLLDGTELLLESLFTNPSSQNLPVSHEVVKFKHF